MEVRVDNRKFIRESTAGAELYLMYTLIRSIELLMDDAERRINHVGYQLKSDQKMWFRNFSRQFKGAIISLSKFDDDIANAYENSPENFDLLNRSANEIVKVLLRLHTANESTPGLIEQFNKRLKIELTTGLPEEDIERFTLK